MSAYPAFSMSALCIVGGTIGFLKTRSIPSLVAGIGIGLVYLASADSIVKGAPNGHEGALASSVLLFVSSLPRLAKGPVPKALALTSAGVGAYYGKTVYALRK